MGKKLTVSSEILENKKFSIKPKGYDALEVDTLLDKVISDYEIIESSVILSREEHSKLLERIKELEEQLINAQIEVKSEKDKWKYLSQDTQNVSLDNYELLKRIGKLEKIIHEKLHLSKEDIDCFDPDDC